MREFTIGVEEEYQLVDASTGELRSRARDVLETDWADEVHQEVQQTMLEVGTCVCLSAEELDAELRRLRFHVATAAASHELTMVAAGLHPFSDWRTQQPMPDERYRRLLRHYGRVLRSEHVFGMHIHVAVPEELDRMRLINRIRFFIPHLLALSASSPIYEGEDTEYASYRTILAQRLPCSGPPPRFDSEVEYWSLVDSLIESGAALDPGTIYWSIRPHATYPTIEVRCADVCPRVEDAVGIAALVRALVAAASEGPIVPEPELRGGSARDAIVASNEWQAARFGLDADFIGCGADRAGEPARDAIRRLIDSAAPVAERLGDGQALGHLDALLARGNAATRIREAADSCETLGDLVGWIARESLTGTGLDRRRAQRETCA